MMKDELFSWAAANTGKYPVLDRLCEAEMDGAVFLFLPVSYGVYQGLYLCFSQNPTVFKLRHEGYAVGVIDTYTAARKLILECAKYTNRQTRKRKKDEKRNKRTD